MIVFLIINNNHFERPFCDHKQLSFPYIQKHIFFLLNFLECNHQQQHRGEDHECMDLNEIRDLFGDWATLCVAISLGVSNCLPFLFRPLM